MNLDWQGIMGRAIDPAINGFVAVSIAVSVGLFVALVFKGLGQKFLDRALIPFLIACDHALITYFAPLAGVGLERVWLRWASFLSLFLALTAIAVFAPIVVAGAAIIIGIVAVLAIYRTWEKDERAREIAEDNGIAPPQANDLGNEIIAGLLFLIVFFTLGFSRVSEVETIYRGEPIIPIATTAFFVWGEVLKALPIVDASEVYGLQNISGYEADGIIGRTLTFVFRVFLDLLLIATLVRLVGIIRRRASGQDLRDVRRLYGALEAARQVDAIEALTSFAMRGRLNAQHELDRIATMQVEFNQMKTGEILLRAAGSLEELAMKFGGTRHLLTAIAACRGAIRMYHPNEEPAAWAAAQNNLGILLSRLGQATDDVERFGEAVLAYRNALEVRTRNTVFLEWVETQINLGSVFALHGTMVKDTEKLENAVQVFQETLSSNLKQVSDPLWAKTQQNLGNAFRSLGELTNNSGLLMEAIKSYEEAFDVFRNKEDAENISAVQNNIGNTLHSLWKIDDQEAYLDKAIDAYRLALHYNDKATNASYWAMTNYNLGNVLQSSGRLRKDRETLIEAISCYCQALDVHTRQTAPGYSAAIYQSLANTYAALGAITKDATLLTKSIEVWMYVLEAYSNINDTKTVLGIQSKIDSARVLLGGLSRQ